MANANFYIIYIVRSKKSTYEQVKAKMDLANDWYRLRETVWVIYSTSNSEKWYKRLSPLVKDDGNIFISKLDIDERQGWMPRSFWKWVRRESET